MKGKIPSMRDIPVVRLLWSKYVPYGEWKSLYMDDKLSNMASSDGGESRESTVLFDYEFVAIRRKKTARNFTEYAPVYHSTDTLISFYHTSRDVDAPIGRLSNPDFPKIRSPGSTMETESRGITEEYTVLLGEDEPDRGPQAGSNVDFMAEDLEEVMVDSRDFSLNDGFVRGCSSRNESSGQLRLVKARIRGAFRRKYRQLKRAVLPRRL